MTAADKTLRPLLIAVVAWNVFTLCHGLDHLRQGLGRLSFEVMALAGIGALLAVLTLVLLLRGYRQAPFVAVVAGAGAGLGLIVSHFLPHWGVFSDPYQVADVDALSWFIAIGDVVAALTVAYFGFRMLRHSNPPWQQPAATGGAQ